MHFNLAAVTTLLLLPALSLAAPSVTTIEVDTDLYNQLAANAQNLEARTGIALNLKIRDVAAPAAEGAEKRNANLTPEECTQKGGKEFCMWQTAVCSVPNTYGINSWVGVKDSKLNCGDQKNCVGGWLFCS